MEKVSKPPGLAGKKRKHKISTSSASEPKLIKLESPIKLEKQKKVKTEKQKKVKSNKSEIQTQKVLIPKNSDDIPSKGTFKTKLKKEKKVKLEKPKLETENVKLELVQPDNDEVDSDKEDVKKVKKEKTKKTPKLQKLSVEEMEQKYPVLKNKELTAQFLQVPLNNNQKGRIRQAIKMTLVGASPTTFPDIIHAKIQAIINSSTDLSDSDLRRIRILYNMLKTALESPTELIEPKEKESKGEKKDKKEKSQKVKGPKRYVVFLGNLPLDISKEKLMEHFKEFNEGIKDIRIQDPMEGKKSMIAYMELNNEPTYELALSRHHSMLSNKRINVLYTVQKNSKISKSQAKAKSAKLIALQKSGKLLGSTPMNKKRSHRRNILKKARAKEAKDAENI